MTTKLWLIMAVSTILGFTFGWIGDPKKCKSCKEPCKCGLCFYCQRVAVFTAVLIEIIHYFTK